MLHWKHTSQGSSALLVDGARRVGKSYIAREFAEREYRSYVFIDFGRADIRLRDLFDHYLDDLDTFFLYLSSLTGTRLYPRQSLIVLDEVQLCPRARMALKYLVADGRYDYLETGSLVSIKKNVADIIIPSEEEHLPMYPMDFEEFLWACGDEMLMDFIRDRYDRRQPMGQLMHRKAMDMLRLYMIVGGMPQAVAAYAEHRDFGRVDRVKRQILSLYRNDIAKFASGYEAKVSGIFEEIPDMLQRHERKFKLSALRHQARFRDYEDAFFWLDDAMMVNMCFNTTEPSIGLKLNRDRLTLKCYLADTGLLISHAFDENTIANEDLYNKLLFDKLEVNKGMLVENLAAQMLRAGGHKLYFFSTPSEDLAADRMEIDFLIAKSRTTSRHNISPIEVKSSSRYTLSSLRKFMTKYREQLGTPMVLHPADQKADDGIVYLPLYMAPLL